MTTLKSFQAEIEAISHEKHALQIREAREAHIAAELAKHHGRLPPKKEKKEDKDKAPATAGAGPQKGEAGQGAPTSPVAGRGSLDGIGGEGHDDGAEASLEDLILASGDTDALRARLASLLLRAHGELLIPLGAHPSPGHLYNPIPGSDITPPPVGTPLTPAKLDAAIERLRSACTALNAECTEAYRCDSNTSILNPEKPPEKVTSAPVADGSKGPYGTWLVRLTPRGAEEIMEVRVAVVGNVDAGKSTTLGVLTRGGLDDGRGKARVALFRHPHEIETGRTSSVGGEILGFSPKGEAVVPTGHVADVMSEHGHLAAAKREKMGWEEICKRAAKVVSFIDLAGHERYFKTTLYGLSGCAPDYVMLMVGGNAGLIGMSKEHLGVALALNVPIAVCVTKIDMTPPNILEQTITMLTKVLKSPGCRRVPVFVNTPQQAVDCARYLGKPLSVTSSSSSSGTSSTATAAAAGTASASPTSPTKSSHARAQAAAAAGHVSGARICPIFMVSNVTGHNLPTLRTFLNVLPSSQSDDKYVVDAPFEFQISDVFSVPFSGTVVSGVITSGVVHANDPVVLGPDSVGQFIPTAVKTIQRKRAAVHSAEAGQSVSFALKRIRRTQVRKGMVLMAKTDTPPKAVRRFEGMVMVLHHASTIQPRYQAMMHCGAIRQTVKIISLDHPSGLIRTGDRSKVVFEFISQAEFVKEGQLILLREAKTKVLGVVTKILG